MKRLSRTVRSVSYGLLAGVILAVFFFSTSAWAGRPETMCKDFVCNFKTDGSSATVTATYNVRGNVYVAVWENGQQTSKYVNQAFDIILCNGYGDVYFLTLLRDRENYQAYRGYCIYRGFSLQGCATTGEVVLLRIKGTPTMPEHISLMSTSIRNGNTMYILNDVFRPIASWVSAGYENWFPFDMSCSVAMYISHGGWK